MPQEQAKSGHEVTIVTSHRVPRFIQAAPHFSRTYPHGKIDTAGTHELLPDVIRLPSLPEVYGQVLLLGLVKTLTRLRPQIVHSHSALSPSSIQCVLLQPKMKYKLFVDDHSHNLNTRLDNPVKSWYAAALSWLYKSRDSSIVMYLPVTAAAARFLTDKLSVPASRYRVVGLGADSNLFRSSVAARRERRTRLGLDDEELMIVSAGKFGKQKLVSSLLSAFAAVSRNHPKMRLVLVGDAEQPEITRLLELSDTLRVRDRIVLHPFAERRLLSEIYNAADIGVWPGEPSITVVEALATGLACVLPLREKAYDLIRENHACETFTNDDVDDLARKIERLVGDPEYRHRLAANAIELVDRRLSWRAISDILLALYMSAAEDRVSSVNDS